MKQEIKELKFFGLALTIATSILYLRFFSKSEIDSFLLVPTAFFSLALFVPRLLAPVHKILASLLHFLINILTYFVLLITFYLVITPIGLLLRLAGKDLLKLRRVNKDTYWIKNEESVKREDYLRQF